MHLTAAKVATHVNTAVLYLARGADESALINFERFAASYRRFSAGEAHGLYIIFKGFASEEKLSEARQAFSEISYTPLMLGDKDYDLGAYRDAALAVPHEMICCLNSTSQIAGASWLAKLVRNFKVKGVGMVACSGSYESLEPLDSRFPPFPNIHLRTNAFVISRDLYVRLCPRRVETKREAHLFESGRDGLTRQILQMGLAVSLVGKDGRGYAPQSWPLSETFRNQEQSNLLICDNVTRSFGVDTWQDKQAHVARTWGPYLNQHFGFAA